MGEHVFKGETAEINPDVMNEDDAEDPDSIEVNEFQESSSARDMLFGVLLENSYCKSR